MSAGRRGFKFEKRLRDLLMGGHKVATWRIEREDSEIRPGRVIGIYGDDYEDMLGTAIVLRCFKRRFCDLTADDRRGHERYGSDDEMIATFRRYYGPDVDMQTVVTIYWLQPQTWVVRGQGVAVIIEYEDWEDAAYCVRNGLEVVPSDWGHSLRLSRLG